MTQRNSGIKRRHRTAFHGSLEEKDAGRHHEDEGPRRKKSRTDVQYSILAEAADCYGKIKDLTDQLNKLNRIYTSHASNPPQNPVYIIRHLLNVQMNYATRLNQHL
jgi:hypothetical protein